MKTLRTDKIDAFRSSLGFNVIDTFNSKQKPITKAIKEIYEGEDIQTKFKVLNLDYRIDMYFRQYKLAIEVDEQEHSDRDSNYEEERQKLIEKKLGYISIRINLDEINCSINRSMNEIRRHIKISTEELTKELTKKETKISDR